MSIVCSGTISVELSNAGQITLRRGSIDASENSVFNTFTAETRQAVIGILKVRTSVFEVATRRCSDLHLS